MPEDANRSKDEFLYPRSRYRGEFSPQHLAFNANLQEFAQRIEFLCNLETNGKISPGAAYDEIKKLYKQLKHSKKALGISNSSGDEDGSSESQ
ncbi:DUF7219 family protein [Leptolyngbya ohadii]|uniref:DUF7219 family protein n=1 Tax=Leptolyngbya ohadii TaxID=1962290 RepID=UPI000B59A8C6|nr:hypothetical protein [Leptolyngbya ohadii]